MFEIKENYIPLLKEILSEAPHDFKINHTVLKTYHDIFYICRDTAECLLDNNDEKEIKANIWAFEKLYKHGLKITANFRSTLNNNAMLVKSYELFKKKRRTKEMKVIFEHANKPSQQAIDNFHRFFYKIVLDTMKENFGHY